MIFKNIIISEFRGIKQLELQDLSMVNVFMGQNNSGKSSILEGIFLLTGSNEPALVLNVDLYRSLMHTEANDFRFIFHNLNYSSKPTIKGDLFNNSDRKLEIIPVSTKQSKSFSVSSTGITKQGELENFYSSEETEKNDPIEALNLRTEIKGFQQPRRIYNSSIIFARNNKEIEFKTELDPKNFKSDFVALYQTSQIRHTNDLPKRLELLIREKNKEELIKNLQLIDKSISDITTFSNGMIYVDIGAKELVPSNLMGDGFLKYLSTILNLNRVKNGILLIDEIDNGLHFTTLKNLWGIIISLSSKLNIQVFITTHSKEALFYLKKILEEPDFIQFQASVNCYTISKLSNSQIKAYKYSYSSMEYALEHDVEIRGEI